MNRTRTGTRKHRNHSPFWAPRKSMCLNSWERTQQGNPHKLFRGNLGAEKRGPKQAIWATKSLVYCFFLPKRGTRNKRNLFARTKRELHNSANVGSHHPSPNVKTPCNFEPKIWLKIITSRDAKSACLKTPKRHVCNNFWRFSRHSFGRKTSHHAMDASC